MIDGLFRLARPLIHALDAETAHRMTVVALKAAPLPPAHPPIRSSRRRLSACAFPIRWASPRVSTSMPRCPIRP